MYKLTTVMLVMLLSAMTFAQPWLSNLPQQKSTQELTLYDYQQAFDDYWKPYQVNNKGYYLENGIAKKAPGWKQFNRWAWYMETQIDPKTGKFPDKTAKEVYQEFIKANGKAQNSKVASWSVTGPNSSDGGYAGIGRINCIAFHPSDNNTYWIGAPAGGLWVTTDNGSSWTCLTDDNSVLGVSDIVIPSDYATSNTIYIATGDRDAWDNRSVGVLKSTDGGTTWNTTGLNYTLIQNRMVTRMLLDPNDDNTIIAATSIGVFKTTNGGSTWSTQLTTVGFIDMEYKPGNYGTLYGSTESGDIYVSTDGGSIWTKTLDDASATRIELAVTADNNAVVFAVASASDNGLYGVYKSTDSGATFSQIYAGSTSNLLGWYSDGSDSGGQGWYDLSIAVSPSDENNVIIGGVNSHRSTNGGTSWSCSNCWTAYSVYNTASHPVVHADKHMLKYRSDGSLFECNDGGVYLSSDDGATWSDKANGLIISQMYKLGVSQSVAGEVITGLQDNGTKLYASSNWSDVKGGDGMECLIDYSDVNIQYGTYTYGQISRTLNHWTSSTDIEPSAAGNGAWVTPYIIDPDDNNTIYAGYADVWKTTDKGDNWTKISTMNTSNKIRSMAIAPSNNSVLFVADNTSIWKTSDGGSSWSEVTGTLPTASAYLTYIAIKNDDPNTVWVTMSGYNSYAVYESSDGGSNWTNISSGLPNIPAYTIVQNKQSSSELHLYVGTELGIYLKKGSDDWIEFNTGLPNVKIGELEIYYNTANPESSVLYAATYGRGLWKSPVEAPLVTTPVVVTNDVSAIDVATATLNGEVTSEGTSSITEQGFVYNTSGNPTTSDTKVVHSTNGTGIFSEDVSGLNSNTTYFVKAFATNSTGTAYGGQVTFTTSCTPPATQASTVLFSNIEESSITISWTSGGDHVIVVAKESAAVDENPQNGTTYSASADFTLGEDMGSNNIVVYSGTDETVTVTHLSEVTNYHFAVFKYNSATICYNLLSPAVGNTTTIGYCQSYALNDGDSEIDEVVFGTINNTTAGVCATYSNFTNLSTDLEQGNSYSLSVTAGTCDGDYGKKIMVFIDWNADQDFEDAGEKLFESETNNATRTYTLTVDVPATSTVAESRMRIICYEPAESSASYCGAYNWGETEDYMVNIVATNKPLVHTEEATSITKTSATLAGNVLSSGATSLVEKGFVYNTTGNPTLDDAKVIEGTTTTGSYTMDITGLDLATEYFYKAYAINDQDTGLGFVESFITDYDPPTLTVSVDTIEMEVSLCGDSITSQFSIENSGDVDLIVELQTETSFGDDFATVIDTYSNSTVNITGMVWVAGQLYQIDYSNSMLKQFDVASQQIVNAWTIHSSPFGIAFDGTSLWIGNQAGNVINYDLNGNALGNSFNLPFANYGALTYGDDHFYTSLALSDNSDIYKLDQNGNVVEVFTPNFSGGSQQLTWLNGKLWVLDSSNGLVRQISLISGAADEIESFSLSEGNNAYALTQDGTNFFISDMDGPVYLIAGKSVEWLSISTDQDTVLPGNTNLYDVKFKAGQLATGIYEAELVIVSNDPIQSTDTIVCIFTVQGSPVFVTSDTEIAFGELFVYDTLNQEIILYNDGCDTLFINSIVSSESAFTATASTSSIQPFDSTSIQLDFTPINTITYSGTLTIATNDADSVINLTGTGIPAPELVMNQDTIESMVFDCNESETQQLLLGNTGLSDLDFEIIVGDTIQIKIETGSYGNEVSWDIRNQADEIVLSGGGYANYSSYTRLGFLPKGDYIFNAYDSYGDGWTGGSYTVSVNGKKLINNDGRTPGGYGVSENFEILSWCSVSNAAGTILTDESIQIAVEFNGEDQHAGTYFTYLLVNSNDPLNATDTVLCIFNIQGLPEMITSETSFDFGEVTVNAEAVDTLVIKNAGCDTLQILDIVFSSTDFYRSDTNLHVLPDDSVKVFINFLPTSTGSYSETVTIQTNDADSVVTLFGSGIAPPVLYVNESLIEDVVNQCIDSVYHQFNIENRNIGDLIYNNTILSYGFDAQHAGDTINTYDNFNIDGDFVKIDHICYGINTSGELLVYNTQTQSVLHTYAIHDNPVSIAFDGNHLWITNNNSKAYNYNFEGNAIGDSIILPVSGYPTFTWDGNYFITSELWVANPTIYRINYSSDIINSYTTNSNNAYYALAWAANHAEGSVYGVSQNTIHQISLEENTYRVVNTVPLNGANMNLGFEGSNIWYTNASVLYEFYDGVVEAENWITLSANADTIEALQSQNIEVEFNSKNISAGDYYAEIVINSNDPLNVSDTIACSFSVLAQAELVSSDTAFYYGDVTVGEPQIRTLTILNTGCDTLFVDNLVSSIADIAINETSFELLGGASKDVVVTFTPTNTGYQSGTLTVNTNVGDSIIAIHGTGVVDGTPLISVSTSSINFGNVNIGETQEEFYTLSASDLTDTLFLSAPSGFQLSRNTGINYSDTLQLIPVGGSITETFIYVKFEPSTEDQYNGVVTHISEGASQVDVSIVGNGVVPDPLITLSETSLSFGTVVIGSSEVLSYTVSGDNLQGNVEIEAPTGYELKLSGETEYGNIISLVPAAGIIGATEIDVRFTPTVEQDYSGNVVHTSTNANQVNLTVAGAGLNTTPQLSTVGTINDFGKVYLSESSASQLIGVSGNNLIDDVIITAPIGFEISFDNIDFSINPLSITPTNGELTTTFIYIRFTPDSEQLYSDNLLITSTDADGVEIAVSGEGVVPEILTSVTSLDFEDVIIGTDLELNYTIEGTNLLGDVTISSPTDFMISLVSGSNFSDEIVLTPVDGTLATTSIFVLFTPSTEQTYNSIISAVSSGANQVDVSVLGNALLPQITTSMASINFGDVETGTTAEQHYIVQGVNISDNISINAPAGYEISLSSGTGFAASLVLNPIDHVIEETTIYVRFSPVAEQSYSAVITHETTGGSQVDLTVSGTGVAPGSPIITCSLSEINFENTILNTYADRQSYLVSGKNLSTGISITAPANFEISLDDTDYTVNPIVISQSEGVVLSTVIYVRFKPTDDISYTASLTNESSGATTYTVSLSGQGTCAALTISDLNNVSKCSGETATFNVIASGTEIGYQWKKGAVNLSDNSAFSGTQTNEFSINNVDVNYEGTYSCQITDACGDTESSSSALEVYPDVSISSQPASVELCAGDNTTLTIVASGHDLSYQWKKDNVNIGTNSATLLLNNVSTVNEGSYTCVVSGTCGDPVTSDAATLSLYDALAIEIQPENTTVCENSEVTFNISATGSGTMAYQWQKDGESISGANMASYTIANVASDDAGTYACLVSNDCGSLSSETAVLTLFDDAEIITQPASEVVCVGSDVELTLVASGDNLTYQWYKNGSEIEGSNTPTLTLNEIQLDAAADYYCKVLSSCANINSTVATLVVNDVACTITTQPDDQEICVGDNLTLEIIAENTDSYQWKKDGELISGATSNVLFIEAVNNENAGTYVCEVFDDCGSIISNEAMVTINSSLVTITKQPESTVVCEGETLELSIEASGATSYQWYYNNIALTGELSDLLQIDNMIQNNAGSYSCEVFDACGSVISSEALVEINQSEVAIVSHPESVSVCEGEAFQLTVTAENADSYQWYFDGFAIPGATQALYQISNANSGQAGTYVCEASDACGTESSNAAVVTVNESMVEITEHPQSATLCVNDNHTLTIEAENAENYQWYYEGTAIVGANTDSYYLATVSLTDAGIYTCEVSDNCGSISSNIAVITVNESSVEITNHPQSAAICENSNHIFALTAENAISYQWFKDGVEIADQTSSTLVFEALALADAGSYTCEAYDACGTAISNAAELEVIENTLSINAHPENSAVCLNEEVQLSVEAVDAINYQWFKDGVAIENENSELLVIVSATVNDEGEYSCAAYGACDSLISNPATLTINALTEIISQPENVATQVGANVSFILEAVGVDLSYQWYFNNESIEGAAAATLVLSNVTTEMQGDYYAHVSGICGIVNSDTVSLLTTRINDFADLGIKMYPNPSDGLLNFIIPAKVEYLHLSIINFEGKVVYQQNYQSGKYAIDLTDKPQGVYLVKVNHSNSSYHLRIVIE